MLRWTVLGGLLLGAGLFLAGCAQNMFYYPDAVAYGTPANAGLKYEPVRFASLDGTRLAGWMIPAEGAPSMREAKGTVIHFHGNAQNMSAHWEFAGWLARRGFNVFVFDYRGYGASEGSPGPRGVYEDSVAALRYVRGRADVDPARLLVFGQSLGGTQAIAAVGGGEKAGVRALAIESTFLSYSAIAGEKVTGAGLLMNDTYSAERHVAALAPIPLLLIHGTQDEVIPASHSERLYALAGEPKTLVTVPGGGHIASMMDPRFGATYRDRLVRFFEAALDTGPARAATAPSPSGVAAREKYGL